MTELWMSLPFLCIGFIALNWEEKVPTRPLSAGAQRLPPKPKSGWAAKREEQGFLDRYVDFVFLKAKRSHSGLIADKAQKS
jgi:hypothetical protein